MSTVLSATLDFNSKLQGLVTELRGEIGTTLRGSKDARERLLRSEYVSNRGLSCHAFVLFCFIRIEISIYHTEYLSTLLCSCSVLGHTQVAFKCGVITRNQNV